LQIILKTKTYTPANLQPRSVEIKAVAGTMNNFKWSYSPDVNAYVIRFTTTARCTAVSAELVPGVIVDYDDQSRIVSLEILQRNRSTFKEAHEVSYEVLQSNGDWLRIKIGDGLTSDEKIVRDAYKIYKIEEGVNGDITAISVANPGSSFTDK
jgi:hypothetical protein